MKISQRLKLEKELHFLKYFLQRPFYLLGNAFWETVKNLRNWMFIGFILLLGFLFRNLFISIINNYLVIDKIVITIAIAIAIFYVLDQYFSQEFQEDYRQTKAKKIEKQIQIETQKEQEEPNA